ncbi:MAG: P1 family peptidase [Eubacteriaceae bacterium]|nr:P1 family peptidase [Eubacteriaceae bacterium]
MKEIRITDIRGVRIGHAQDMEGGTGCTAVICEDGAVAGVDVRGGGPASRETELLRPEKTVQKIHCVMLSGGSAYGLEAGDGAMRYLEEKGIGLDVGAGIVPLVCGASLFDLVVGDPKCRPDKEMGHAACIASEGNTPEGGMPKTGCVGAGTGATVGKFLGTERMMKSGPGIYAAQIGRVQCAAVVAVNAAGDVIDYDSHKIVAGILSEDKTELADTEKIMYSEIEKNRDVFKGNTTLGCVITNAALTKDQAYKLAQVSHNGYVKTINPVHTSVDGDTIFAMSVGDEEASPDILGAMATEVMARAVNDAVYSAVSMYGLKSARDLG